MSELDPSFPGHVTLLEGNGGLPKLHVKTRWSTAEIYLHGAHVTHFQKQDEPPLLFLSEASDYAPGKPIRGGVPIVFPWFGGRDGLPIHGHARLMNWKVTGSSLLADGSVELQFSLSEIHPFELLFKVTIGQTLSLEMFVRNGGNESAIFDNCFHTYFQVSSIHDLTLTGLAGAGYLDTLRNTDHVEGPDPIRIREEVDRIYFDTAATVEIHDPNFGRVIRVRKSGSQSTVVWNPWIAKSERMPDFGDNEYLQMVCVESGNLRRNAITLDAGASATLRIELESF